MAVKEATFLIRVRETKGKDEDAEKIVVSILPLCEYFGFNKLRIKKGTELLPLMTKEICL